MAAYRDSADWLRNGVRSGHLIADSKEELQALVQQLELSPRFNFPHAMLPHYQLPVAYQEAADALGVIPLEREAFTRMAGRVRDRWETAERASRQSPKAPPRPARTHEPEKPAPRDLPIAPEQPLFF